MSPEEYANSWRHYVHELRGEGTEAKQLLAEMERAWRGFSDSEKGEVAGHLFNSRGPNGEELANKK